MSDDAGSNSARDLRAELEAARRELAETAEALAARSTPRETAPVEPAQPLSVEPVVTPGVEIVPATTRPGSKAPVLYRPVPSARRRVAVGVALGLAALLLRRLAR